jgi:hypothetical protein
MSDRFAFVRDCELRNLVEQLDEAATRLVDCHNKWLFGEVLPKIFRTNRYDGGEAAVTLARIDAPSIADTILKAAAYLDNLRLQQTTKTPDGPSRGPR